MAFRFSRISRFFLIISSFVIPFPSDEDPLDEDPDSPDPEYDSSELPEDSDEDLTSGLGSFGGSAYLTGVDFLTGAIGDFWIFSGDF